MPYYYAVRHGRIPGVYWSWQDCQKQILKFRGAKYKKFKSFDDATNWVNGIPIPPPKRKEVKLDPNIPTVYTDGAYSRNRKKAGAGVYFGPDDPRNKSADVPGKQTNNRGELYAIQLALELTEGPLQIMSDSKYCIHCIRKEWQANSNLDLLETIWKLCEPREIRFCHVYAHSGVCGNENADKLAVAATFRSE